MIYRIFKTWMLFAFLAAGACGLVYLAVQQTLRMGANDPQIQMAEDAAALLQTGIPAQGVIPQGSVTIGQGLAPYVVVFDVNGNPLVGNGSWNASLPRLPMGVFAYTLARGEDRLTWQPRSGVRQAIVVTSAAMPASAPPVFVMAGRSLRDVEIREDLALREAVSAWLAIVAGIFIIQLFFYAFERREASRVTRA
jgi:hypothetical protein